MFRHRNVGLFPLNHTARKSMLVFPYPNRCTPNLSSDTTQRKRRKCYVPHACKRLSASNKEMMCPGCKSTELGNKSRVKVWNQFYYKNIKKEKRRISQVIFLKPGISQNIVLLALPTARNCSFVESA